MHYCKGIVAKLAVGNIPGEEVEAILQGSYCIVVVVQVGMNIAALGTLIVDHNCRGSDQT